MKTNETVTKLESPTSCRESKGLFTKVGETRSIAKSEALGEDRTVSRLSHDK